VKARTRHSVVFLELSHREANLLVTALVTHTEGNRAAVPENEPTDRAMRQLLDDADDCERLADTIEGVL